MAEFYGWMKDLHDEIMSTWRGRMRYRWEYFRITLGEWWWFLKGWIRKGE